MQKLILLVISCVAFLFFASPSLAAFPPLSVPNNRFGIHIIDEHDLEDAAALVNSNGGQWGYVTVVIPQNDQNQKKWQSVFDQMRELKLIPIVRLASSAQGDTWARPTVEDIDKWVSFLNSLNWVIENRYVVLFNEPNHDKEWGGKSNASEYVEIANSFITKLKLASDDFIIMPAGFDLTAGNTSGTTDAEVFFKQMQKADADIFKKFDAWSSHSYPNPDFSGKPTDTGRKSIRGFLWELNYLSSFGLKKDIPVFITETGWVTNFLHSEDTLAEFYKSAYESAWNHPQIVAVTPFVLSYSTKPFDSFSWKKTNDPKSFFKQFSTISGIKKTAGEPRQIHNFKFLESPIPSQLFSGSFYTISPQLINSGQSIWEKGDVTIKMKSTFPPNSVTVGDILELKPGQTVGLPLVIKTPGSEGTFSLSLEFYKSGVQMGEKIERQIEVIPPTELVISAQLGWKAVSNTTEADIIIYEGDRLIKKVNDINIVDGTAKIPKIHDVIPGQTYRFVIINSGYLPQQTVQFLQGSGPTVVTFKRLLPFDFNVDGKLSISDIGSMFLHPLNSLKLLSPR